MRILVTGAAGFIGQHVAKMLEAEHYGVGRFDVALGSGDITGNGLIHDIHDCDGVVHLASKSREKYGKDDPIECLRVNILGTASVLACAAGAGKHPWVILGSTRDVPIDDFAHASIYGLSWRTAEEIGRRYALDYGLRVLALRFSDVYGAGDHPDKALPVIMRYKAAGARLLIKQDRLCDFTHVDDVTRAIRLGAEWCQKQERPRFEAVTICTGVVTRLSDLAGCDHGDVRPIVNDVHPAEELLGFKALIPLEKGLS